MLMFQRVQNAAAHLVVLVTTITLVTSPVFRIIYKPCTLDTFCIIVLAIAGRTWCWFWCWWDQSYIASTRSLRSGLHSADGGHCLRSRPRFKLVERTFSCIPDQPPPGMHYPTRFDPLHMYVFSYVKAYIHQVHIYYFNFSESRKTHFAEYRAEVADPWPQNYCYIVCN